MTERREPPIGELIAFVRKKWKAAVMAQDVADMHLFSALLARLERADASGTEETAPVTIGNVLRVWDAWRSSLVVGAFTHSDGLRFVRAVRQLEAVPPVASAPDWQERACRAIEQAIVTEDGLDGADGEVLLREVGYWPKRAGSAAGSSTSPLHAETREDDGAALITAERARQVSSEGWTPEHDDSHDEGEMAVSAARYALHDAGAAWPEPPDVHDAKDALGRAWRWASCDWKPKDPIRNLVRAGALIAAEIDRRQRAARDRVAPPSGAQIEIARPLDCRRCGHLWALHGSSTNHDSDVRRCVKVGCLCPDYIEAASPPARATEPEAEMLADKLDAIVAARASTAPPPVSHKPCASECSVYVSRCGARFCTVEAASAHDRECIAVPPTALGPSDEKTKT